MFAPKRLPSDLAINPTTWRPMAATAGQSHYCPNTDI